MMIFDNQSSCHFPDDVIFQFEKTGADLIEIKDVHNNGVSDHVIEMVFKCEDLSYRHKAKVSSKMNGAFLVDIWRYFMTRNDPLLVDYRNYDA